HPFTFINNWLDVLVRVSGDAQHQKIRLLPTPCNMLCCSPPTGADSASLQVGLTPPYPVKKEIPEMNAELIRRYIRLLGIVYATIGTEGKLPKFSIRETPDVRFT